MLALFSGRNPIRILLLTLSVSVVSAVGLTSPVQAAFADLSIDDRVRAVGYYYQYGKCSALNGDKSLTPNEVVNGPLLDRNNELVERAGFAVSSNNRISCEVLISQSVSLLGFPNRLALFQTWGYKLEGEGDSRRYVGEGVGTKRGEWLRNTFFKSDSHPRLNNAERYHAAYKALTASHPGCELRNFVRKDSLSEDQRSVYETGNYIELDVVANDPVEVVTVYAAYTPQDQYDQATTIRDYSPPIPSRCTGQTSNLPDLISSLAADYARWAEHNTDEAVFTLVNDQPIEGDPDEASAPLCVVEHGLGWILCPLTNTLAAINDGAFSMLQNFLESPPMMMMQEDEMTGRSETTGTYRAWGVMRSIANVLFIIFFMVIVFSQISSVGISNYGIKKLLPKLIVAAILVNTSFFIVAAAVDLSNVVGRSIYNVNNGIVGSVTAPPYNPEVGAGSTAPDTPSWQYVAGSLLVGTAGAAVGTAAFVMAGLSVLLPLLLGAIFFIGGLVILLVFRHAVVFILAAVAPIAFVSYLLPNTDGFFKTWYKFLKVLLFIYPAVAFIMGMSNVAAAVVWSEAQRDNNWVMMMVATAMPGMGVLMALLAAKTMGAIGSKLGFKNPFGGMTGAMKNYAKNYGKRYDNINAAAAMNNEGTQLQRFMGAGGKFKARGAARNSAADRSKQLAEQGYISNKASEDDAFARKLAAGGGEGAVMRVRAEAKAVASKELSENINNIMSTLDKEVASDPVELQVRFKAAADTGNLAEMAAYQKLMVRNGSPGVDSARASLENYTDLSELESSGDAAAVDKRRRDIVDLKDILSGDESFQRAGRDFEVWSNNEHSQRTNNYRKNADGSYMLDSNGNRIEEKAPHANFGAVKNDLSIWENISAQRFSQMSPSSQGTMIKLMKDNHESAGGGTETSYAQFLKRMQAAPNAMENVKEERRKVILEDIETIGLSNRQTPQQPQQPNPQTPQQPDRQSPGRSRPNPSSQSDGDLDIPRDRP